MPVLGLSCWSSTFLSVPRLCVLCVCVACVCGVCARVLRFVMLAAIVHREGIAHGFFLNRSELVTDISSLNIFIFFNNSFIYKFWI